MQKLISSFLKFFYRFKLTKLLVTFLYKFQKIRIFLRIIGLETNGYLVDVPRNLKPPLTNLNGIPKTNLFDYEFPKIDKVSLAKQCKTETGVYPISFSFPDKKIKGFNSNKLRLVSEVLPGDKYSFDSEYDYYRQYEESCTAYTMKKAGWDCYRHLEIMANNCVPIFLDSGEIPRFTMVHYPKDFFKAFEEHFFKNKSQVTNQTLNQMCKYFSENLSTSSMARYILDVIGLSVKKVLFIDNNLIHYPDYLSVSTLIGLKQVFGKDCDALYDPNYIYADTNENLSKLYGRGFGYAKSLASSNKNSSDGIGELLSLDNAFQVAKLKEYDLLVLGSFENNPDIFDFLSEYAESLPQIAVLHGGDFKMSLSQKNKLINSNLNVFVREI